MSVFILIQISTKIVALEMIIDFIQMNQAKINVHF